MGVFRIAMLIGCLASRLAAADDDITYFDLRDIFLQASANGGSVEPLVTGQYAAGFNDQPSAERYLRQVIALDPKSNGASAATTLLAAMYLRNGQVHKAYDEVKADLTADSDSVQALATMSHYPEMTVVASAPSRLRLAEGDSWLRIPLSINGKPSVATLDTGSVDALILESDAKRFGVAVHDEHWKSGDIEGNPFECRVGIAERMTAGGFVFQDVMFCVILDALAGTSDAAPELGEVLLGLPVMLAFRTMRWGSDGMLEMGFPSLPRDPKAFNICFHITTLAVDGVAGGQRTMFELDTGNEETFVFPRYRDKVSRAAGNPLAKWKIRLGGADLALNEVAVESEAGDECPSCYGNLGMDLLRQARRVTIDFGAMQLRLEMPE